MAAIGEMTVIVSKVVISDQPPGNAPRLMLIFRNPLSCSAQERVKESLGLAHESYKPIVIYGPVEVFQLIDGKWLHLDGSVELEDAPVPPAKVNFREFL
jgi:hypothetical protein